jgi:hypothetical protein
MMETYDSGQTVSTLSTSGKVCPNCGNLNGGTTSNVAPGLNFRSRATDNQSGQAVGGISTVLIEAATNVSNVFKQ